MESVVGHFDFLKAIMGKVIKFCPSKQYREGAIMTNGETLICAGEGASQGSQGQGTPNIPRLPFFASRIR